MNTREISRIDRILAHSQLAVQDFRVVEVLGNDAFDYIREILSKTSDVHMIVNGLSLLIRLATQFAQDSAGPRLPEVFEIASSCLVGPTIEVRVKSNGYCCCSIVGFKRSGKRARRRWWEDSCDRDLASCLICGIQR